MQLVVVIAAKRYGKFIANLTAHGAALRESKVMGITGLALADDTGLCTNKGQMGFAPPADFLWQRNDRLLDKRTRSLRLYVSPGRGRYIRSLLCPANSFEHRPVSGLDHPGVVRSQSVFGRQSLLSPCDQLVFGVQVAEFADQ
jgi:hypothetical protein